MIKSEVAEIKKQFKVDKANIVSVATCLVNGEKEKIMTNIESGVSLNEDDLFKYLEIMKATLSGKLGKCLIDLQFPVSEESAGGTQEFLYRLNNAQTDKLLHEEIFDKIIENYAFGENYMISVVHCAYDVPRKASDGAVLEDGEETYGFIVCSISPLKATKAGLKYNQDTGRMESAEQILVVDKPVNGFLFPAFNDRQSDIHSMLWFTKKADEPHNELMTALTGTDAPKTPAEQKTAFEAILADASGDQVDYDTMRNIHENLQVMAEQAQMKGEQDAVLKKEDIKGLLTDAGITGTMMDDFEHVFERHASDSDEFKASNLMDIDKFNVKVPDVELKVKPDRADLVESSVINGRRCLVVSLEGDIEVNGLPVAAGKTSDK